MVPIQPVSLTNVSGEKSETYEMVFRSPAVLDKAIKAVSRTPDQRFVLGYLPRTGFTNSDTGSREVISETLVMLQQTPQFELRH